MPQSSIVIAVIGDAGTGKTSLISHLVENGNTSKVLPRVRAPVVVSPQMDPHGRGLTIYDTNSSISRIDLPMLYESILREQVKQHGHVVNSLLNDIYPFPSTMLSLPIQPSNHHNIPIPATAIAPLLHSSVILLTVAPHVDQSMERVTSYWLPLLHILGCRQPLIIAPNAVDMPVHAKEWLQLATIAAVHPWFLPGTPVEFTVVGENIGNITNPGFFPRSQNSGAISPVFPSVVPLLRMLTSADMPRTPTSTPTHPHSSHHSPTTHHYIPNTGTSSSTRTGVGTLSSPDSTATIISTTTVGISAAKTASGVLRGNSGAEAAGAGAGSIGSRGDGAVDVELTGNQHQDSYASTQTHSHSRATLSSPASPPSTSSPLPFTALAAAPQCRSLSTLSLLAIRNVFAAAQRLALQPPSVLFRTTFPKKAYAPNNSSFPDCEELGTISPLSSPTFPFQPHISFVSEQQWSCLSSNNSQKLLTLPSGASDDIIYNPDDNSDDEFEDPLMLPHNYHPQHHITAAAITTSDGAPAPAPNGSIADGTNDISADLTMGVGAGVNPDVDGGDDGDNRETTITANTTDSLHTHLRNPDISRFSEEIPGIFPEKGIPQTPTQSFTINPFKQTRNLQENISEKTQLRFSANEAIENPEISLKFPIPGTLRSRNTPLRQHPSKNTSHSSPSCSSSAPPPSSSTSSSTLNLAPTSVFTSASASIVMREVTYLRHCLPTRTQHTQHTRYAHVLPHAHTPVQGQGGVYAHAPVHSYGHIHAAESKHGQGYRYEGYEQEHMNEYRYEYGYGYEDGASADTDSMSSVSVRAHGRPSTSREDVGENAKEISENPEIPSLDAIFLSTQTSRPPWLQLLSSQSLQIDVITALRRLFMLFDEDQDGKLNYSEFSLLLGIMNPEYSNSELFEHFFPKNDLIPNSTSVNAHSKSTKSTQGTITSSTAMGASSGVISEFAQLRLLSKDTYFSFLAKLSHFQRQLMEYPTQRLNATTKRLPRITQGYGAPSASHGVYGNEDDVDEESNGYNTHMGTGVSDADIGVGNSRNGRNSAGVGSDVQYVLDNSITYQGFIAYFTLLLTNICEYSTNFHTCQEFSKQYNIPIDSFFRDPYGMESNMRNPNMFTNPELCISSSQEFSFFPGANILWKMLSMLGYTAVAAPPSHLLSSFPFSFSCSSTTLHPHSSVFTSSTASASLSRLVIDATYVSQHTPIIALPHVYPQITQALCPLLDDNNNNDNYNCKTDDDNVYNCMATIITPSSQSAGINIPKIPSGNKMLPLEAKISRTLLHFLSPLSPSLPSLPLLLCSLLSLPAPAPAPSSSSSSSLSASATAFLISYFYSFASPILHNNIKENDTSTGADATADLGSGMGIGAKEYIMTTLPIVPLFVPIADTRTLTTMTLYKLSTQLSQLTSSIVAEERQILQCIHNLYTSSTSTAPLSYLPFTPSASVYNTISMRLSLALSQLSPIYISILQNDDIYREISDRLAEKRKCDYFAYYMHLYTHFPHTLQTLSPEKHTIPERNFSKSANSEVSLPSLYCLPFSLLLLLLLAKYHNTPSFIPFLSCISASPFSLAISPLPIHTQQLLWSLLPQVTTAHTIPPSYPNSTPSSSSSPSTCVCSLPLPPASCPLLLSPCPVFSLSLSSWLALWSIFVQKKTRVCAAALSYLGYCVDGTHRGMTRYITSTIDHDMPTVGHRTSTTCQRMPDYLASSPSSLPHSKPKKISDSLVSSSILPSNSLPRPFHTMTTAGESLFMPIVDFPSSTPHISTAYSLYVSVNTGAKAQEARMTMDRQQALTLIANTGTVTATTSTSIHSDTSYGDSHTDGSGSAGAGVGGADNQGALVPVELWTGRREEAGAGTAEASYSGNNTNAIRNIHELFLGKSNKTPQSVQKTGSLTMENQAMEKDPSYPNSGLSFPGFQTSSSTFTSLYSFISLLSYTMNNDMHTHTSASSLSSAAAASPLPPLPKLHMGAHAAITYRYNCHGDNNYKTTPVTTNGDNIYKIGEKKGFTGVTSKMNTHTLSSSDTYIGQRMATMVNNRDKHCYQTDYTTYEQIVAKIVSTIVNKIQQERDKVYVKLGKKAKEIHGKEHFSGNHRQMRKNSPSFSLKYPYPTAISTSRTSSEKRVPEKIAVDRPELKSFPIHEHTSVNALILGKEGTGKTLLREVFLKLHSQSPFAGELLPSTSSISSHTSSPSSSLCSSLSSSSSALVPPLIPVSITIAKPSTSTRAHTNTQNTDNAQDIHSSASESSECRDSLEFSDISDVLVSFSTMSTCAIATTDTTDTDTDVNANTGTIICNHTHKHTCVTVHTDALPFPLPPQIEPEKSKWSEFLRKMTFSREKNIPGRILQEKYPSFMQLLGKELLPQPENPTILSQLWEKLDFRGNNKASGVSAIGRIPSPENTALKFLASHCHHHSSSSPSSRAPASPTSSCTPHTRWLALTAAPAPLTLHELTHTYAHPHSYSQPYAHSHPQPPSSHTTSTITAIARQMTTILTMAGHTYAHAQYITQILYPYDSDNKFYKLIDDNFYKMTGDNGNGSPVPPKLGKSTILGKLDSYSSFSTLLPLSPAPSLIASLLGSCSTYGCTHQHTRPSSSSSLSLSSLTACTAPTAPSAHDLVLITYSPLSPSSIIVAALLLTLLPPHVPRVVVQTHTDMLPQSPFPHNTSPSLFSAAASSSSSSSSSPQPVIPPSSPATATPDDNIDELPSLIPITTTICANSYASSLSSSSSSSCPTLAPPLSSPSYPAHVLAHLANITYHTPPAMLSALFPVPVTVVPLALPHITHTHITTQPSSSSSSSPLTSLLPLPSYLLSRTHPTPTDTLFFSRLHHLARTPSLYTHQDASQDAFWNTRRVVRVAAMVGSIILGNALWKQRHVGN